MEKDTPVVPGGLRGDDGIIAVDEKGRYLVERDGKRVIVDLWMIEPVPFRPANPALEVLDEIEQDFKASLRKDIDNL